MARRGRPIELGIDTTPREPVNLQPGRRRRPSAWDEGMLEALPRLLMGLLYTFAAVVVLLMVRALFFAPIYSAGPPPNLMDARSGWERAQDRDEWERIKAERSLEDDER